MKNAPRRAFLVSHTHWDREWYLPQNRFRVNLVAVVDRVLDALDHDPEFLHFVLDGQTAVVEDYLQAAPHQRERLLGLVRQGKLAVGPWFILPDEFLVSGEATVRNLLLGSRTPPVSGLAGKIGYMPDSFGHLAQLPQILRSAGIDNFIFTRGLGDEAGELGWLFRWAAPDGTQVLAVNQCDGYCNAGGLGFAEIWHAHTRRRVQPELAVQKVTELLGRMAARPGAEPALLNNGCDHFPPQQEFPAVMAALRDAFPGTEFTHGGFAEFLAAVRAEMPDAERPLRTGEMLGGRDHLILSGVWSARMYLKQQNELCQNLLARYLEPALAYEAFLLGGVWPAGLVQSAWRELLRNHPHDSICGCSTDAVHLDMETRFAAVRQTGEQMLSRLMDRITPMFAREEADDRQTVVTVLNPLPVRRSEVIDRLVVLQPLGYALDRLRLVDETGREVPCEILSRRFLERFWGIDYRMELFCDDQLDQLGIYLDRFGDRIIGAEADQATKDCFLHLRFLAEDLPACGHRRYFLKDSGSAVPLAIADPVSVEKRGAEVVLANARLEAVLHPDGTIDLTDRLGGAQYPGLNLLEDSEDCGDEYDHSLCAVSQQFFSAGCDGKVRVLEDGGLMGAAEAVFRFDLPRGLERDRRGREERTVPCDVTVRIELRAGSGRLDITTGFANRARDHRLRAWFPTPIETGTCVADGHFMLNRRPLARPAGPDWSQPAPPCWPQQDFAALQDGRTGLAVFNRGLPEYQTWAGHDGGAVYALTLLRCVDWLSRDDFTARRQTNAGPTLFTPDAQCLGRQTFRYAVAPFGGDLLEADIKGQSERYRTPPLSGQGVADQSHCGDRSLLEKSDPRAAITAVKVAEKDGLLVVRLYNQSEVPIVETLKLGLPALTADKVGLLEDPLELDRKPAAVTHGGQRVAIPLAPFEIATIAIALVKEDDR